MLCDLYLIRHGQTQWNYERRIQGSSDIPLNDTGVGQIKNWIPKFQKKSISAVYSSALTRAAQSAKILATALNLPVIIKEDLHEALYGPLEGMTIDEFQKAYAEEIQNLHSMARKERIHFQFHDSYESEHQILERVIPCLRQIARDQIDQSALIVTHGWVMKALFSEWKKLEEYGIHIHNSAMDSHPM